MSRLPEFRLETFFSRWEFSARYHLCASDIESMGLAELLELADDELRAQWEALQLGYVQTFGTPRLRRAIAAQYERIDAEEVLVFAGAEEGIFCAMQALLEPADHALVLVPNYQSAETLPASICALSGVALEAQQGWRLDLDRVRAALRPNTRLLSINFPHNPTGKVIEQDDLEALVDLARERGIYLFSDEVYRGLERQSDRRLPQLADLYERGLSLNVMSKVYGLPGLRVGWIASRDRELLSRMERVKHYLSICNAAPSELLATIALRARERVLARSRAIVEPNLELLGAFFADYPALFEWYLPDGGCIGYPRYLGADGATAFCERLVEEAGVLLLPSSVYRSEFGESPGDRFRIGYGRRDMPEALAALRQFLS